MKKFSFSFILILTGLFFAVHASVLKTPLEARHYQSLPDSREINRFLQQLAEQSSEAKLISIGKTAGGREMTALLVSSNKEFLETGKTQDNKLAVLLIGSQHGTEPSGCEGLLKFTAQLLSGNEKHYLPDMNFIIIANGNPDGRDQHSRFNAHGGNINVDFTRVAYPETQAVINVLRQFQIDALLDLHESSAMKKILTLQEGFYRNAEAQYEVGNNPNIDPDLLRLGQKLLPELIRISEEKGLPGEHYLGEILKLDQPVAHGGLKISNLRNYSAMQGIFSVLVENRLDPNKTYYETPQNIKVRSEKQLLSILSFLTLLQKEKPAILKTVRAAKDGRQQMKLQGKKMRLIYGYDLNTQNPVREVALTDVASGHPVKKPFPNFDYVSIEKTILIPDAYAIKAPQKKVIDILKKHRIVIKQLETPRQVMAMAPRINTIRINYSPLFQNVSTVNIDTDFTPGIITLAPGDFLVPTHQPLGKLIPLFLDLRAVDSIYQKAEFRYLLTEGMDISVFPVKLMDQDSQITGEKIKIPR
ncbi:M14 family zinc carboxypeptidase [Legionella londiniensis]|uniref:Zinc carboxypeptidase n=1 Tax=Legionella londiniensis TaxID=45068 RepID=A0A0W0VJ54_9GAMM|nr:M14 family zinc carboxypeptidase [Legionella londiniensis]KTD19917.1 Zinc carboxypeptidase [Legionella londiniensis]STX94211.1 Zinc carboxypeptidase [Legionella londiniensis]